jgi:hypothetical protein
MNEETAGRCNDEEKAMDPELIVKPGLCILCKNDDTGGKKELILCLENRKDQEGHLTFECDNYKPKNNC